MGMLATLMNALALESDGKGGIVGAHHVGAEHAADLRDLRAAPRVAPHRAGKGGAAGGGTGNPFFTTDTTAVLRAAELGAEAVLKATDVDGAYSADPKQNSDAERYDRLTHQEALERNLKVMDTTAFALARENRMPIIVFSIREKGAIAAVLRGEGRPPSSAIDPVPAPASRGGSTNCSRDAMANPTHDINELQAPHAGCNPVAQAGAGRPAHRPPLGGLLEPVQVEAYGTHMPLNQVATVSVPEPRLISVQVWDKSMVHAVEKAIAASNLGLTPRPEGPSPAAANPRTQRGAAQGAGQGRA